MLDENFTGKRKNWVKIASGIAFDVHRYWLEKNYVMRYVFNTR